MTIVTDIVKYKIHQDESGLLNIDTGTPYNKSLSFSPRNLLWAIQEEFGSVRQTSVSRQILIHEVRDVLILLVDLSTDCAFAACSIGDIVDDQAKGQMCPVVI